MNTSTSTSPAPRTAAPTTDLRIASLEARLASARADIVSAEAKRHRIALAIETRKSLILKLEASLVLLAKNDHALVGPNAP